MEADITSQAVGLGTNTDFSLMSLFLRADIVVKSVIIILIVCSIYSWAVIIDKLRLWMNSFIYLSIMYYFLLFMIHSLFINYIYMIFLLF